MRRLEHWTPRYVGNRLAEIAYQKSRPSEPWLTRAANLALASLLKPTDVGLEFGSGRSTIWFARHLGHLTSVEHNKEWHAIVGERLKAAGISNVAYEFRAAGTDETTVDDPYVAVSDRFADDSLDFALVDGAQRGLCAKAVLSKLRRGGLLVVDNANWYLPSNSTSPNSRSQAQGATPGAWTDVHCVIREYRKLWTTNGVSDTAIFFKS